VSDFLQFDHRFRKWQRHRHLGHLMNPLTSLRKWKPAKKYRISNFFAFLSISFRILTRVHSFLQSDISTECNLVLPFPFPVPSRFYKFIQKLLRLLLPLPVTSIQDYYSLSLISFASSYWLASTSHNHVRIAVVTKDIFRITLRNSDYTTGETTQAQ
jgi:hypothetical protein